jgi:hypothetical protein
MPSLVSLLAVPANPAYLVQLVMEVLKKLEGA